MENQTFVTWASQIQILMEGQLERQVTQALEELISEERWDLLSHLMLTGSEFSVRRIADSLIEREVFEPLVAGACLRREVRRSLPSGPADLGADRIFRDFEAPEDGEAGVPDHIMEEAEAISKHAQQTRRIAAQREAELDRDPMRTYIVDRLGELLNTSEEAMEAMLAIARTSAFEETARMAAMKLGSSKIVMGRISRAGRVVDMLAVAEAAGSQAVETMIARTLAESMPESSDPSYRPALQFVAEHHPQEATRQAARQALSG